jgi:hypothetical protein
MSNTVVVASISTGGAVAVAVTALILNFRLFNSLERPIEVIESGLKQFFKTLAEHDKRISRLEEH